MLLNGGQSVLANDLRPDLLDKLKAHEQSARKIGSIPEADTFASKIREHEPGYTGVSSPKPKDTRFTNEVKDTPRSSYTNVRPKTSTSNSNSFRPGFSSAPRDYSDVEPPNHYNTSPFQKRWQSFKSGTQKTASTVGEAAENVAKGAGEVASKVGSIAAKAAVGAAEAAEVI